MGTYIIGTIVFLALAYALFKVFSNKNPCGGNCGGNCTGCGRGNTPHR